MSTDQGRPCAWMEWRDTAETGADWEQCGLSTTDFDHCTYPVADTCLSTGPDSCSAVLACVYFEPDPVDCFDTSSECATDSTCRENFELCAEPKAGCGEDTVPLECDCMVEFLHCQDGFQSMCDGYDCARCTKDNAPSWCFEPTGCCSPVHGGSVDCALPDADMCRTQCLAALGSTTSGSDISVVLECFIPEEKPAACDSIFQDVQCNSCASLYGDCWLMTEQPTQQPTHEPTQPPSQQPAELPSQQPNQPPSQQPAELPSQQPNQWPSQQPIELPSQQPTEETCESVGLLHINPHCLRLL